MHQLFIGYVIEKTAGFFNNKTAAGNRRISDSKTEKFHFAAN